MGQNLFKPIKALPFIFLSLTPLILIFCIGASLIVYDRIQTYKDRRLGAELIKNLKVESACGQKVKAGDKFDISFTFTNGNNAPIKFQTARIEKALVGEGSKKFMRLTAAKPPFSTVGTSDSQYLDYNFESLSIKGRGSLPLTLTFQTSDRVTAGAQPHTFVIYSGQINFDFEHEIIIEAPCEIQVVYAE